MKNISSHTIQIPHQQQKTPSYILDHLSRQDADRCCPHFFPLPGSSPVCCCRHHHLLHYYHHHQDSSASPLGHCYSQRLPQLQHGYCDFYPSRLLHWLCQRLCRIRHQDWRRSPRRRRYAGGSGCRIIRAGYGRGPLSANAPMRIYAYTHPSMK